MSEPLAKDLVRNREVQPRLVAGIRLVDRLLERMWRRPVGNSAKLWKKVGAEDPFARPAEESRPEHRAVYASGRFVRIDQAEKEAKKPGDKLREAPRPQPKPKSEGDAPKPAPKPVHTPAFGQKAPSPFDRPRHSRDKARPTPPPSDVEVDRTPPIVPGPGEASTSRSGRIRTAAAPQASRKPVMSAEPPGGVVPIVARDAADEGGLFARRRPGAPEPRTVSAPKPPQPAAKPAPPPPPAPRPSPPAPQVAAPPKPAAPAAPPAAAAPSAPTPRPPAAAPPAAASPASPAVAPLPPTPEVKLPPGAINTPGPPQSVPVRRPTRAVEPEPEAPAKPAATPNRAPPMPAGGGGLDDLFGGGAQEGRVRIGRAKPKSST